MKRKFEEYAVWITAFIVFGAIAVNMTIDNIVPKKFVCKDNVIAEQLTPVDIQTMADDCFNKCEYDNVECLQLCTNMVKTMVEATSPNSD